MPKLRRSLAVLVALPLLAGNGGAASAEPPRRIALLIGVANYQNLPERGPPGKHDLRGPENDVPRMQASLLRFGFRPGENMLVLTDSQASRAGMMRGFRWLQQRAVGPADVVVIFYAGHGSTALDQDGDELLVEGDQRDEGLVPWDVRDMQNPDQLILDDSMRVWLARLPTTNVTLIVDACYSGTITRDVGNVFQRGPPPDSAAQTVAPTSSAGMAELKYTVITAAHSQQTATETDMLPSANPYVGMLTFALTRALDGAASGATWDVIMSQVRAEITASGGRQVPQLEARAASVPFELQDGVARRPFAEIARPIMIAPYLPIGAAQGVRAGAIYDVYPPNEVNFERFRVGRIRVDSTTAGRAFFTQLENEADGPLPAGSRAVLARVPLGARELKRMDVHAGAGVPAAVKAEIATLPFVSMITDSAQAQAAVGFAQGRAQISVAGHALAPMNAQWLASEGITPLCNELARAFAITALRMIENPQPMAGLSVEARMVAAGSGPPREARGVDTLYAGERYETWFRIYRPANHEVYFSAMYAGYLEQPFVIYPKKSTAPRALPLEQLGQWVKLDIAPENSYVHQGPFGVTQLVMYVGTTQFDFHRLVDSLPGCKAVKTRADDEAASGWLKRTHTLVLLPARN